MQRNIVPSVKLSVSSSFVVKKFLKDVPDARENCQSVDQRKSFLEHFFGTANDLRPG